MASSIADQEAQGLSQIGGEREREGEKMIQWTSSLLATRLFKRARNQTVQHRGPHRSKAVSDRIRKYNARAMREDIGHFWVKIFRLVVANASNSSKRSMSVPQPCKIERLKLQEVVALPDLFVPSMAKDFSPCHTQQLVQAKPKECCKQKTVPRAKKPPSGSSKLSDLKGRG